MYTENRIFEYPKDVVSFGASEMLMDSMNEGIIDCAVVVCDGAGTVIVPHAEMVQGIGIPCLELLERVRSKGFRKSWSQKVVPW